MPGVEIRNTPAVISALAFLAGIIIGATIAIYIFSTLAVNFQRLGVPFSADTVRYAAAAAVSTAAVVAAGIIASATYSAIEGEEEEG